MAQESPADPQQIRDDRFARGKLLGELIDTYGADAVVKALGVQAIAHILGLNEPIPDPAEDDFDEC